MNTINVENCKTLLIGRRGENEVTTVAFDFTEWATEFGSGVVDLYVKRFGDDSAYPVVLTIDGTVASWLVTETDTNVAGYGKAEYVYRVDGKIAKSAVFPFFVAEDIGQPASEPPDPYESWLEQLTALGAETEANAQAAEQSAENAAESAEDAAGSATSAESYAGQAETAAGLAQAAQTASEAARDAAQTAQASAEASATAASGSAASAAGSASDASASATAAGASATTASTAAGQAEAAKNAAQAAQSAAEDAAEDAQQAAQQAHVEYEQLSGEVDDLSDEVSQQKSAIDDLSALVDRKAGMLVDTASGSIASFVPDASVENLLGVSVDIEPVQDLHGYDAPWPAGGGKNKFDPAVYSAYLQADGTFRGQAGTVNTVFAYMPANLLNTAVTFSATLDLRNSGNLTQCLVQAVVGGREINGTRIINGEAGVSAVTFTPTSETDYVHITFGSNYANYFTFSQIQLELGSTATAFAPYENICPISGWDAVEVEAAGVNLFDKAAAIDGYIDDADGAVKGSAPYKCTDYVAVVGGSSYYVKTEQTSALWGAWYDKDKVYVGRQTNYANTAITAPANAAYLRLTIKSSATGNVDTFAINYPSTDHSYHPYVGNRYTIQLGQTVYGGTLDVTNGTLMVDRAAVVLDGSEAWGKDNTVNGFNRFYIRDDAAKKYTSYIDHMWSNAMETAGSYAYFDNVIGDFAVTGYSALSNPDNYVYIVSRVGSSGEITTVDSLKQWLANQPVQVMYELATPIEIALDPVTIAAIARQANNVWANTGDVSVEFAADLKNYIDSKIAAAVAAMS